MTSIFFKKKNQKGLQQKLQSFFFIVYHLFRTNQIRKVNTLSFINATH